MLIWTACVAVVRCYDEPIGGVYYLEADLRVPCYDAKHWLAMVVAVSAGLVFALGIPVGIIVLLKKRRADLSDPSFFRAFGFM